MRETAKTVHFFLGANGENGFVSHFAQLQNPYGNVRPIILKGGPGTGKSSLMRRIAEEYAESETLLEQIHCSSDPDSLDGVILTDCGAAVVDGTPPHTMEPKYPLAVEQIVNLLDCGNETKVRRHKGEIVSLSQIISGYHHKFCELLCCANNLMEANRNMIRPFIDQEKMKKTVARMAKKEFRRKPTETDGEKTRLLSAFTPQGLVTYEDTIRTLCSRVWFIHDEYRVCTPVLLGLLREELLERGYSFYSCYSAFKPETELEALLIPELDLAFVTVNRFMMMDSIVPYKVMNVTRFIDLEIFRIKKQKLSFYRKTANELLREGVRMLEKAKETHDELEKLYIPNMDFDRMEDKYQQIKLQIAN